jgi:hypothetical protein
VIKELPSLVKQGALIDPVAMLLNLPTVPHAFLYNRPCPVKLLWCREAHLSTARALKRAFFELAMFYVVSTELTIANAMRRQFWWVFACRQSREAPASPY